MSSVAILLAVAILNSCYEGIVVVDEAYVDFSENPSLCYLLDSHPRLILLQTLPKAFGLAGIRLGMAMAHEEIVEIFNRVKFPYSVNKLTSNVAHKALSNTQGMKDNVHKILEEKKKLVAELKKLPYVKKIFPSDSNFILVRIEHAYELYKTMAERGVVTRYRGDLIGCDSCVRFTIGTPEDNNALLCMIRKTYEEISGKKI